MAAIDDILGGPAAQPRQPKTTTQTSTPQQPTSTPQQQPQAQAPVTDAAAVVGDPGTDKPRLSYAEMYQLLNPNKPETAEERAKREKREKSEAAIAAVGDTISALSNLYFTSQYAPNAYDPSKGVTAH